MKQALELEWKPFDVKSLDGVSVSDLKAITRSMEELGIREHRAGTMLPFEPGPTGGNRISVPDFSPTESAQMQIARLDAAAADVPVIAERNQLSDQAREMLATMIKKRGESLRQALQNIPKDEEVAARWSAIQRSLRRNSTN